MVLLEIKRRGKSKLIEQLLIEEARLKNGRRYVKNFSAIARRFGVQRELVRQIAYSLGIHSAYRSRKGD